MSSWGTPALLLVFIASAGATWIAGLYLSKATDVLAWDPVLPTASTQSLWLGLLGAILTGIFAYGLLIRSESKLGFIGRDSLLALLVYLAGVALLTAVPG